jgi:Transglycosylase SLT domain
MQPEVQAAITQAAQEAGVNPAFALAVADRESGGDPNAHASKSIYGLFQMRGDLRSQYGAGDSSDPYTQAKAWTRFIGDTRSEMAQRLGRQPTDAELYAGHYFGEGRAARMIGDPSLAGAAPSDVFTPQELAGNPNLARAGSIGGIMNGLTADIGRREARYGGNSEISPGNGENSIDFASFGQPENGDVATGQPGSSPTAPIDFAQFGSPAHQDATNQLGAATSGQNMQQTAPGMRPGTEVDLSQFGQPAAPTGATGALI